MQNPTTHDRNGNPWAKLSEVKAGDTIVADGGFTCMEPGPKIVRQAKHGLCINCVDGDHYLSGQADDGEHLVGLYHGKP